MSDLQNPIFTDDNAARRHLESLHWPHGPECPHCMAVGNAMLLKGASTRPGVYKCKACRKPFSVTVGTIFERSHIPLTKWLLAVHLLASSKKGISSHQLHRSLGVTYKTAWFMSHRIREAMRPMANPKMGSGGGTVEIDETFLGNVQKNEGKRGYDHKEKIVSLLETGVRVRSHHIENIQAKTLRPILARQLAPDAHVVTDGGGNYRRLAETYKHTVLNHRSKEYSRGGVTTNHVEGYFSVFKRGMIGVYQHCGAQHLRRYLTEFDFRYNERKIEDRERAMVVLMGMKYRRLTYRGDGGLVG